MSPAVPSVPAPPYGALFYVAAVNIVIWAGLFLYLFYIDRKVRAASGGVRTPEDRP
jgi:CcmD family protein